LVGGAGAGVGVGVGAGHGRPASAVEAIMFVALDAITPPPPTALMPSVAAATYFLIRWAMVMSFRLMLGPVRT